MAIATVIPLLLTGPAQANTEQDIQPQKIRVTLVNNQQVADGLLFVAPKAAGISGGTSSGPVGPEIVDNNGHSMIDPEHWHLMSSVPDWAGVRPDRPVPAATVEIVSQGATRDRVLEPGPSNINWLATWRNPDGANSVTFRPRMVIAPAL